jgi:hypothetical protein
LVTRQCTNCGSDKTYEHLIKGFGPYPDWRSHEGNWYCKKCYNNLFHNAIINKKYYTRSRDRRVTYKGEQIYLKEPIRKHICSICGYKGITNLHHYGEYIDEDPTANTIELCRTCHTKETWKLGQYDTERYRARIILRDPITQKLAGSMSGSLKPIVHKPKTEGLLSKW